MGILIVIAVLWLSVRLVAVLRMVARGPDDEIRWPDAPRPGSDAPASGPQDALVRPQDSTRADLDPCASSVRDCEPASALSVAVWRIVVEVSRELAARRAAFAQALREESSVASTGDSRREWLAALRETITDSVSRPDAGPACLGGRDDDKYLRGWDDAVDWISQGRDAESPTWGDVAYMTGWNDAVRDIGRARSFARAWPTPR